MLNTPDTYVLVMPSGSPYIDRTGRSEWTLQAAKIVARNLAVKCKCTVRIVKVEDLITNDSPFDLIINYVDSLKGKALTNELKDRGLPVGGDPVASKRQRLISHLVKVGV